VITRFFLATSIFLETATRRDVCLVPNDWVQANVLGFAVKLKGSVQISVVSNGQGIHSQFTRTMNKPINRTRTIKQTVMAVTVEMGE
jgi:hypothetical protein